MSDRLISRDCRIGFGVGVSDSGIPCSARGGHAAAETVHLLFNVLVTVKSD